MCTYFKAVTDAAKNRVDDFLSNLTVRGPSHRKDFKWGKKYRGTGLISERAEGLYTELYRT